MHLHYGDMTDSSCLVKIISEVRPTEIYNLAAQSHVKVKHLHGHGPLKLTSKSQSIDLPHFANNQTCLHYIMDICTSLCTFFY